MLDQILDKVNRGWYNSAAAYQRHLNERLRLYRKNRDLAFADSIGSESIELFIQQGPRLLLSNITGSSMECRFMTSAAAVEEQRRHSSAPDAGACNALGPCLQPAA